MSEKNSSEDEGFPTESEKDEPSGDPAKSRGIESQDDDDEAFPTEREA